MPNSKHVFIPFIVLFFTLTGTEAVAWLIDNWPKLGLSGKLSRPQAIWVGNLLMRDGLFTHVTQSLPFLDKECFYVLNVCLLNVNSVCSVEMTQNNHVMFLLLIQPHTGKQICPNIRYRGFETVHRPVLCFM